MSHACLCIAPPRTRSPSSFDDENEEDMAVAKRRAYRRVVSAGVDRPPPPSPSQPLKNKFDPRRLVKSLDVLFAKPVIDEEEERQDDRRQCLDKMMQIESVLLNTAGVQEEKAFDGW